MAGINMKKHSTLIGVLSLVAVTTLAAACGPAPAVNNANATKDANVPANTNTANTANANNSPTSKAFSKTLELHGVKFVVESQITATGNTVKVTPSGLEINDVQTKSVNGEVYGAEIADLNIDQSPEVYIYSRESGPNGKATLTAFAANKKKSLSEISLAPDDSKSKEMVGFNGGDEFAVVESSLVRRFSIFEGSGADAKKSAKMRQIQYKLKPGEASWQLVVDKVSEF